MIKNTFSSCLATVALLSAFDVHADEISIRKAGLWEMKERLGDPPVPETMTHQCIGEALPSTKEVCSRNDIRKTATGYIVDSVCSSGDLSTTRHSEIVGDTNSQYIATSTTRRQRGSSGVPIELTMTTEAKWLGDCKPDQKPGDIIMMPSGLKMNINDAREHDGKLILRLK
ncbi:DUF3617 family protein [Afipia sp. GAS231]|uniref:DUF3617 domain-containing protein n=1 Tax=Afipia sp. GAS231 TaxID=1882747 RepID=UPI0008798B35|nr:DUF3617 family protein [Afipia sp. GAS231]SDO82021.1 Protein of unknown function [Afipia sp. GAS231]